MTKTRVLIVDDSPLVRQVLSDILRSEPDIEVVGIARDGQEGVELAASLRPDVITLDVEMPRLSGLEALRRIMASSPTSVIMCSSLTSDGAQATMKALEAGAIDFICKPDNGAIRSIRSLKEDLIRKVRGAKGAQVAIGYHRTAQAVLPSRHTEKVIVVASSTGGPKALACFFEHLPRGLRAPILIVQHMPTGFIESFAKRLTNLGTVPCAEARVGDVVTPGRALIAPSGRHMHIGPDGRLEFTDEAPMHGVRPAADYLFQSAAKVYGSRVVGVVMTGMGKDGAVGAVAIKEAGGIVFGEAESTCTVYGMPRAAMATGAVAAEIPIHEMAHAVVASLGGKLAHAS